MKKTKVYVTAVLFLSSFISYSVWADAVANEEIPAFSVANEDGIEGTANDEFFIDDVIDSGENLDFDAAEDDLNTELNAPGRGGGGGRPGGGFGGGRPGGGFGGGRPGGGFGGGRPGGGFGGGRPGGGGGGIGRPGPSRPPGGGIGHPGPSRPPGGGIGRPGPSRPPGGGIGRPGPSRPPGGGIGHPGPGRPGGGIGRPGPGRPGGGIGRPVHGRPGYYPGRPGHRYRPYPIYGGSRPWPRWNRPYFPRPVYYWDWQRIREVTCTSEDSYGNQYPVTETASYGYWYGARVDEIQDASLDRCFAETNGDAGCFLVGCTSY